MNIDTRNLECRFHFKAWVQGKFRFVFKVQNLSVWDIHPLQIIQLRHSCIHLFFVVKVKVPVLNQALRLEDVS
jgi:hypothetical protein